jgi:hypothetical protein
MPNMPQQANMIRYTAQRDQDEPSRNDHQGDRSDIDPEDVDLGETHYVAPESK